MFKTQLGCIFFLAFVEYFFCTFWGLSQRLLYCFFPAPVYAEPDFDLGYIFDRAVPRGSCRAYKMWQPASNDVNAWLQVDFGSVGRLYSVITNVIANCSDFGRAADYTVVEGYMEGVQVRLPHT